MSKKNKWQGFGHKFDAETNADKTANCDVKADDAEKSCAENCENSSCDNDTKSQSVKAEGENGAKACEREVDEINNLKAQLAEWQNKYLRAYADAENTKRRAEIDAKNLVDYKVSAFAKDMIPLSDNISLALSSMQGKVDENILVGLRAIQDNFLNALEKNGISKIKTLGEKLNPLEHRVVTQIESDEPVDTIVQELQAGYKIGDKVIREAMVATAKPKQ